jgi:hypothetical protein
MKPLCHLILVLGLMIGLSHSGAAKEEALSATLENAVFKKESSTVELDFVLTNTSAKPIYIAERWNSGGAYQWTIRLTNADKSVIDFENPQQEWSKNFLSLATIEPGKQLRTHCLLMLDEARLREVFGKGAAFVATKRGAAFSFPLRMRGVFAAKEAYSLRDQISWTGSVESGEIEVAK